MGLFDKLLGKEQTIEVATEKNTLYLPIEGEVIPLEEIGDGVFSAGVLGKGCGIKPSEEKVYAPVNGTVTTVAESRLASSHSSLSSPTKLPPRPFMMR